MEGYVTWDVTAVLKAARAFMGQEFDSAILPPYTGSLTS